MPRQFVRQTVVDPWDVRRCQIQSVTPAELIQALASVTQLWCHRPLVVDDALTGVVVSPPQDALIFPPLLGHQLLRAAQTCVKLAKVGTLVRRAQFLRISVSKSRTCRK